MGPEAFSQRNYGMDLFEDLFTPRQALSLTTLARLVREAGRRLEVEHDGLAVAVQTCLAISLDKQTDLQLPHEMEARRRVSS